MTTRVLEILKEVRGIVTDSHFVYTSGKHGSVYVNKDAIYPHIEFISEVCLEFAKVLKDCEVDAVVSPALGGIILSQWTAFHLGKLQNRKIMAIYAEKGSNKDLIFTRNYDALIHGKNVVAVEDITNTGGSLLKLIEACKGVGANVLAAATMVNRSPATVNSAYYGVPFTSLCEFPAEAFSPEECPLCKQGIPFNSQLGHARKS